MNTKHEAVRQLGAYEAIFTRAQRGNFMMAASFAETVPSEVWESAIAALIQRHPMLRVQIEEKDGGFVLVPAEGGNVHFSERRQVDGESWREIAGRWLAGRIGVDSKELVRVLVIQGEKSSDLLLGIHHALVDGRSALGLLEDLMRAIDGLKLNPYPMRPDIDQLLEQNLAVQPEMEDGPHPMDKWKARFLPYERPWTALETASFSAAETKRLAQRARAEGTTVTGALAAAMVNGWRTATPARMAEPTRLMMPVDVRPRVALEKELMLAISTTNQVVLPDQTAGFWDLARRMRTAVGDALTDQVLLKTAAGRAAAIQSTHNKPELDALSEELIAWELLVSNLGIWEPSYRSEALRLTDIWGPAALYGFEGERGLGAVTFAGELRLTLSSRTPAPGLLEAVCQELHAAML